LPVNWTFDGQIALSVFGGGGGGGSDSGHSGGHGGSGIVIVRYASGS
jgi:hypothetical protein